MAQYPGHKSWSIQVLLEGEAVSSCKVRFCVGLALILNPSFRHKSKNGHSRSSKIVCFSSPSITALVQIWVGGFPPRRRAGRRVDLSIWSLVISEPVIPAGRCYVLTSAYYKEATEPERRGREPGSRGEKSGETGWRSRTMLI
ncbi:hypothetical protein CRENBAI_022490 [Crenichthys baileyi]|uniref:Uncharacterized protein n=1 Tax=Crenichthys baileyi TaxID=28760 RepID=A0AAV9R2Z9_9TELE